MFSESVGVNMHIPDDSTPYAQRWPEVLAALKASGIRYVRDSAWPSWWGDYSRIHASHVDLANDGIGIDLLWSTHKDYSSALVTQLLSQEIGAYMLEGPNELDIAGDPNWVANDRAAMSIIAAARQKHRVIAPSVTSEAAFGALGDLTPLCDYGNLHNYYANRNPETPGWGGADVYGTYGAATTSLNWARRVTLRYGVMVTETGYDSSLVPSSVVMKYTLRTLLYHYVIGIARTYLYQFVQSGSDGFGHFGLLNGDLTPTPAYTAVSALLRLLAGATDLQQPTWFISPVGVTTVTLQRGQKQYVIAWQPVQSIDPDHFTITPCPPIAVQTPGTPSSLVTVYTFASDGTLVAAPYNGGAILIDDGVTIIERVL